MSSPWLCASDNCGTPFSGSDAVGTFYGPGAAWYYFNTALWYLVPVISTPLCCSKFVVTWSGTYSGAGTAVLNVSNADSNFLDGCRGVSLGSTIQHTVVPGPFTYTFPDLYVAGATRALIYANNGLSALDFVSTVSVVGTNLGRAC